MGGLLGFFSRKAEKSSKDVLEELERQIKRMTRSRQRNQQYERSFVSYLLLVSFGLYLVGVAVLYLYFRPSSWGEWIIYLTPLILFPVVVYMIKKLLNLYFSHRKTLFDQELSKLHEEKRRVLNVVMEKETYKTAIELLQHYEPNHPSLQRTPTQQSQSQGGRDRRSEGRSEVRRRAPPTPHPAMLHQPVVAPPTTPAPPRPDVPPPATPRRPTEEFSTQMTNTTQQPFIPPGMCLGAPPGPPTPCPILPRDRSKVDKVVEYLVGDGPNNRYALICRKCHSHNGMALRDEFEYITFRCAYCYQVNPARKKKPSLASLKQPTAAPQPEVSQAAQLEQPARPAADTSALEQEPETTQVPAEDTSQKKPTRQRRSHRNSEGKDSTDS